MARWNPRIAFVDCFAGPGEYAGREFGSPILVLDIARKFVDRGLLSPTAFTLAAIEFKKRSFENLIDRYNSYLQIHPQMSGIDNYFRHGTYEEMIGHVQRHLNELGGGKVASFYFIDPFGVSQTPYSLLSNLLAPDKAEVLFNLMYEEVNRFMEAPEFEAPLDTMFGESHWRALRELSGAERKSQTVQYFKSRLINAGAKHIVVFEMRNDHNATDYFLFFATKSMRGLEVMKEAMWQVDPSGAFTFSDYTHSLGPMLITPQPNYAHLQDQLLHRFRGHRSVPMKEIRDFVLAETSFLRFRNEALKPMIARGDCYVERTSQHPSARLDADAEITFLSKPGTSITLF
ncbi:MAG: tcmP [Candidatus Eremiobacteraeota bacterium]|nr:tcmP [Candidatus Eremiobacteraeota bacterium]